MTVMTPMEGITAPARRAETPPAPAPDPLAAPFTASRRADGWSAERQRAFLEAIAEGHGVERAAARVGLSATSAFAFRRSAKGSAFALGWRAATLVAREAVAETLMVRALEGQTDSYVRADGSTVTRHRHDNRLALGLLHRLDRQVESAPAADAQAARLVAQEFDAFLDCVAAEGGAARAGLFLARRSGALQALLGGAAPADSAAPDTAAATASPDPAVADALAREFAPILALAAADRFARTGAARAEEVDVADLDAANRQDWTAAQWARAEAAGLVTLAAPRADAAAPDDADAPESQLSQHSRAPVWWDETARAWRTHFPPPYAFHGAEEGLPGERAYARALTPAEERVMGPGPNHYDDEAWDALIDSRDAWFTAAAERARVPAPPTARSTRAEQEAGAWDARIARTPLSAAAIELIHRLRVGARAPELFPADERDVSEFTVEDSRALLAECEGAPSTPRIAAEEQAPDAFGLFAAISAAILGDPRSPGADDGSGAPGASTDEQPGGDATAPAPRVRDWAAIAATPAAAVDVEQALGAIERRRGAPPLAWRTSIVDLLTLLDLDASLAARKALATELGYTGPLDGSAEMNVWLHRAVMRALEQSGAIVSAALRA
ncbi:DUF3597 family protein [Sphingomonas sp. DT-51]|uniref:DUF3597 family protein n=1 Tax=Sphingomonas sp. DT-51 TaxID=3396165 RepID=UPI003F1CF71B